MNNRLGIYFFYDKDGTVDEYVFHFLRELKILTNRIVFIANGFIKEEYIKEINSITNEIILRENTGLDVYALKYTLNYIGFENLGNYDEVIYCNSTFFGPIFPLEDMFNCMDTKKGLDFWGITQHPDYKTNNENIPSFNLNPYGYIPKHIQYYFVVYRNRLLKSKEFCEFFKNMPIINDYFDAVGLFETVFTKHFEDLGYEWGTYVNYIDENMNYPLLYKPYDVVYKYKCPIIKRKSFYLENELTEKYNTLKQNCKILNYLKDNNLYDTNMIIKNINRSK